MLKPPLSAFSDGRRPFASPPEAVPDAKDFRPSRHGFRFGNRFETPLLSAPLLGRRGLPGSYGLCGGMAQLARDHFHFGLSIPDEKAPPPTGSQLHRTLFRRQLDTWGGPPRFPNVLTFARWTTESDAWVEKETLAEWRRVRRRLEAGKPTLLGLVYVRRLSRLWQNHQVLAYAFDAEAPQGGELRVYDPNYPLCDDVVIRLRTEGQQPEGLRCELHAEEQASEKVLRGFFMIPLPPERPPANL